jgi:hypothetical protein
LPEPWYRVGAAPPEDLGEGMNLHLTSLVIGCLIVLTAVGVITNLLLDAIGRGDTCPYCSAPLARSVRICPG